MYSAFIDLNDTSQMREIAFFLHEPMFRSRSPSKQNSNIRLTSAECEIRRTKKKIVVSVFELHVFVSSINGFDSTKYELSMFAILLYLNQVFHDVSPFYTTILSIRKIRKRTESVNCV